VNGERDGETGSEDERTERGARGPGVGVVERTVSSVSTASTGSSLVVRLDYADSIAGFDALGERGKPAEDVAREVVEAATSFHEGGAAVDAHTADQLVVFLALCGGRVRIPRVTDHVESSLGLVGSFGFEVGVDRTPEGPVLVGDGTD
jgi:RNA 3'-terminal phosphate cyclase (ATP)